MTVRNLVALAVFTATALTAAGPLEGPASGYVLDTRLGSIRALSGLPGAMRLGPIVPLAFTIRAAVFSPEGDAAASLEAGDDPHLRLSSGLSSGTPVTTDFGSVASTTRLLDATSRAVLFEQYGDIYLARNYAGNDAGNDAGRTSTERLAGKELLLSVVRAGVLEADANCAYLATTAVEKICSGNGPVPMTESGPEIVSLALRKQAAETEIWALRGAARQVLRIRSGGTMTLQLDPETVMEPGSLAVSGRTILILDRLQPLVITIDADQSSEPAYHWLPVQPAMLRSMPRYELALITAPDSPIFSAVDLHRGFAYFFIAAE